MPATRTWTVILFVGLAAMDMGCSDDKPLSIDGLADALGRAYCGRLFACCDAAELSDSFDGASVTAEMCPARLSALLATDIAEAKSRVADGSLGYDGKQAATCVNTISVLACPEFAKDPEGNRIPACDDTFVGKLALGAACMTNDECAAGFCDTITGSNVCKARPQLGQPCVGATCALGLYCDTDLDMCQPPKANGMPCTGLSTECASGNCQAPTATTGGVCVVSAYCDGV